MTINKKNIAPNKLKIALQGIQEDYYDYKREIEKLRLEQKVLANNYLDKLKTKKYKS
ncbi:MAG: hypothetical protein AAB723_02045 [Patescibacteria group bacterium]